ncbi:unnamed protein product, partial [Mesorhabditis spiculigera]
MEENSPAVGDPAHVITSVDHLERTGEVFTVTLAAEDGYRTRLSFPAGICKILCNELAKAPWQREQSEALPLLHPDGSEKKPELPAQNHKPTRISTIDEPPESEGEAEYQDWSSSPEQHELPIATPTQTKSPQNDEAVPVTTRVTEEEKPTIGPKKQKTAAPVQEFQAATPNVPAQTLPNESLRKHPSAVGEEKSHIVAEKNTATFGSSITETVPTNRDESVAVEPEEVPIPPTSQKERSPKTEAASPIKSPRERTPIKLRVDPKMLTPPKPARRALRDRSTPSEATVEIPVVASTSTAKPVDNFDPYGFEEEAEESEMSLKSSRNQRKRPSTTPAKKPAKFTKLDPPPGRARFIVTGVADGPCPKIEMRNRFGDGYDPAIQDLVALNEYSQWTPHCFKPSEYAQYDGKGGGDLVRIFPYSLHFPIAYQPSQSYEQMKAFYQQLGDVELLKSNNLEDFPSLEPESPRPAFELELDGDQLSFVFLGSGVAAQIKEKEYRVDLAADRNPLNLRHGDLVWAPWNKKGKKEYWPAYIYNFQVLDLNAVSTGPDDTRHFEDGEVIKVVLAWMSDIDQYDFGFAFYKDIRPFDTAFSFYYDPAGKVECWFAHVAQAITAAGKVGYWEDKVSDKVLKRLAKMPQAKPLLANVKSSAEGRKAKPMQKKERSALARTLTKCYAMAFAKKHGTTPDEATLK